MKTSIRTAAVATALLGLAGVAQAGTTTIDLGASAENFVLYGQGPIEPGIGFFTNQQGDEVYDAVTDVTTDSLTGSISDSNDPSLATGTYDLVTTYEGTPIGDGGYQVESQSNPSDVSEFYYDYFDPSLSIDLYLTTTSGLKTIPLVTNGAFDGPLFSFAYTTASCGGAAVSSCDQNDVGLTYGAYYYGPVTTTVSYTYTTPPAAAPEPATWALMIGGMGIMGAMLRHSRRHETLTTV